MKAAMIEKKLFESLEKKMVECGIFGRAESRVKLPRFKMAWTSLLSRRKVLMAFMMCVT